MAWLLRGENNHSGLKGVKAGPMEVSKTSEDRFAEWNMGLNGH